ncbi:MAG: Lar family restriction alleviation protein [Candidatus Thorarchaeota archaeon]
MELKPCPFCGGKGYTANDDLEYYAVLCRSCECSLGFNLTDNGAYDFVFKSKEIAIIAWNRRE